MGCDAMLNVVMRTVVTMVSLFITGRIAGYNGCPWGPK